MRVVLQPYFTTPVTGALADDADEPARRVTNFQTAVRFEFAPAFSSIISCRGNGKSIHQTPAVASALPIYIYEILGSGVCALLGAPLTFLRAHGSARRASRRAAGGRTVRGGHGNLSAVPVLMGEANESLYYDISLLRAP